MSSLIPVHAAENIRDGISEYLSTSFSLADHDTAEALKRFFSDPESGMFHGPYVRCRLPYAQATGWENVLEWLPDWFTPYQHQADAFRRLRSFDGTEDREPEPTLVVTGTGSGKTEAFLYPVIDHARRMKQRGVKGVKALLLYPMNALANDQLNRLDSLFAQDPDLADVSYGIYTGEISRINRTLNGKRSVSKSRDTLQVDPPDILLTNYKMLDQLLLRPADRAIWKASAHSLQYLVLDEFHTYDGAQGTDVALLLRRLGLMLKSHQVEGFLDDTEAQYPLGQVTPVATSATLGAKGDDEPMLQFAHTVFGRPFTSDCVVSETMVSFDQWRDEMVNTFGHGLKRGETVLPDSSVINEVLTDVRESPHDIGEASFRAFCSHVWSCNPELHQAIAACANHPLTQELLEHAASAVPLQSRELDRVDPLPALVLGEKARRLGEAASAEFISYALAALSYIRSSLGRENPWGGKRFPGVDVHMWCRELSRIERATALPETGELFRWSDDGPAEEVSHEQSPWLPACYCRICGRSGWMVRLDPGTNAPNFSSSAIRQASVFHPDQQRVLIDATPEQRHAIENDQSVTGPRVPGDESHVMWLHTQSVELSLRDPSEEEEDSLASIPVLTFYGRDAAKHSEESRCPSCGEHDAIRYVGSSVATLLSVSLSNLFGMPDLDRSEKKTLVFSDSVQDAAHRAGFVQARSRTFALRTLTRKHIGSTTVTLDELPTMIIENAGSDNRARYELLPATIADYQDFKPFWSPEFPTRQRRKSAKNARSRLEFDLMLEFGQRAHLARSLVSTASLSAHVKAPEHLVLGAATEAIDSLGVLDFDIDDQAKIAWAHGILEIIRLRGGIYHSWLRSYIDDDGNSYLLNRASDRAKGIPPFPRGGSPEFPRIGPTLPNTEDRGVSALGSPRGRYAQWTAKFFNLNPEGAARAVRTLVEKLAASDVIYRHPTNLSGTIFSLSSESVLISSEAETSVLECDVCHGIYGIGRDVRALLEGAPCLTWSCSGSLAIKQVPDNYYRRLYSATEPGTVIAREHTSLLQKATRQGLEHSFRGSDSGASPDSPNVLVATPTLEMGIDIGDLSTVMLSSLPSTVASYVQRVGRAGRLTGSSLSLALVQGRGETLPKLNEPLSIISGTVTPPAAFLSAVEILQRQLTAFIIDSIDLDEAMPKLATAFDVFYESPTRVNLVDFVIENVHRGIDDIVEAFIETVADHVDEATLADLRTWATQDTRHSLRGSLRQARDDWKKERFTLRDRKNRLRERQDQLSLVDDKADEELNKERRTVNSSLWHTDKLLKDLTDEHWVSSLERFGILPNFALLDDTVELSVSVSKLDPQTQEFDTEAIDYRRNISTAIEELAPGAVFYAQGIAAQIDSVEIGNEGSAVEKWRLCPKCSYSEVDDGPRDCPRCGDKGFADSGAVLDILPLKKVSAEVEQTRSAITDSAEYRDRVRFNMHSSFVVPEGSDTSQWFIQNGFGAQYLRTVDIRWFNLGKGPGEERMFAGRKLAAPLFRVCRHCGHIDSHAGENAPKDHRPWCPHRDQAVEDTIAFALARTLRTQGVLVYLPEKYASGADTLTIPSLTAALRLGFKEVLGGNPYHLNISTVRVEGTSGHVDALLIHDLVPGGTGYLKQFSEPQAVRNLLEHSLEKLKNCRCESGDRLCCPDCLLPYAPPRMLQSTSRETAISCITQLLYPGGPEHKEEWDIAVTRPVASDSSVLETRFRTMLRSHLEEHQAHITERDSAGLRSWDITLPNDIRWRMTEQKNFGRTIPDFYFEPINHQCRPVAMYLDGAAFHVSNEHNRVESDIQKRSWLAAQHIQPFSLTHMDLKRVETGNQAAWHGGMKASQISNKQLNIGSEVQHLVDGSQFELFLSYLINPREPYWTKMPAIAVIHMLTHNWERAGNFVSSSLHGRSITLTSAVRGVLPLPQKLTLDLPDSNLDLAVWNDFLNLSNLLWFSEDYVEVEAGKVEDALEDLMNVEPAKPAVHDTQWARIESEFGDDPDALAAIHTLIAGGSIVPSDIGEEFEGVPSVMSWEAAMTVMFYSADDIDSHIKTRLETSGWNIIFADQIDTTGIPSVLTPRSNA